MSVPVYKVFCMNDSMKKDELIGALAERRRNLRGESVVDSASKWAKLKFGPLVRDGDAIFVVPDGMIEERHGK